MWGELKADTRPAGMFKPPVPEPREHRGGEKFACQYCGGMFTIEELKTHACTYNPLPIGVRRKAIAAQYVWDP